MGIDRGLTVAARVDDNARVRIEIPERLSDGVVALRPLRDADVGAYAAAFAADPELGRLIGVETDPDEAAIRARVGDTSGSDAGRHATLAIADAAADAFLGCLTLHTFDWTSRRCELGVWLATRARGRGAGTRAVSLALSWAFAELELLRVEMTTTPDNAAVPELARRLGFTREGLLRARNVERGERVDIVWFGLLREEWLGRAGASQRADA